MTLPAALADLPIIEVLAPLGEALLAAGSSAIVVAPPGAGKTTAIPLWLADQPWLSGKIVVLEPRRLATRAAAQRMASLLGQRVGDTVGYQTRDERHIGPTTRIEVVTEGVLTRRLQHDPSLEGIAVVIFDEIHERNLPTDVGLALALDARSTLCPDLRLLAMSATPDATALRRVLAEAPVVQSDGRLHPVELRWLPMSKTDRVDRATTEAVLKSLATDEGDVLVFLPGIGEIRQVQSLLAPRLPADVDVHLLAGALSIAEHDAALAPSPPGRRRVVLSTDIAESSLTVDGVRIVVDAGLARVPRYDQRTGMTRLTTISTSRASADQRAGRAGRTTPGVCYRLWSKLEQSTRRAHLDAEITAVDLAGLALELAAWGTPVDQLRFIDPPPARTMQQGRQLLAQLGALDADGRITDRGRRMINLPLHPRLARMVEGAGPDGVLACIVATLLDDRDVLRGRPSDLPSDLALRVDVVAGRLGHDAADRGAVRRAQDRAADLCRRARITWAPSEVRSERSGLVAALAYPDRLAVRRSQPGQFQLRTGSSAFVAPTDPLADERFVIACDLDGDRKNARIRLGAALDGIDVATALADEIEVRQQLVWDKTRDDLVLRTETLLGSMLLDDQQRRPAPGSETAAALIDRVRNTRLAVLAWNAEATALRHRMRFVGAQQPGDGWPDWSDGALIRRLDEWLAPYLLHATGSADLRRLDLSMLLTSELGWDRGQRFAELAPPSYETAAGRSVPIDYSTDRPTVAVRVNDVFGTSVHPTVAAGEPLTMQLLSPAGRPIQITADLPGFWRGSWADVRKEMAGRYPKHFWPVDPTAAPPKRLKER